MNHHRQKKIRTDLNPSRLLTFKIDERDVSAREDESILTVARQNGISIPTLCHLDGLSERGACRLCIVEVKGVAKLLPACVTFPRQDMEVITNSERVRHLSQKNSGTAVHRAQPCLFGLRFQRSL